MTNLKGWQEVWVRCADFPGPGSEAVFIEVETPDGHSVWRKGLQWKKDGDEALLGPFFVQKEAEK